MSFIGFESFYAAAKNGTLPQVSYLIGPMELSERTSLMRKYIPFDWPILIADPPWGPRDGGWLQSKRSSQAVVTNNTSLTNILGLKFNQNNRKVRSDFPFHGNLWMILMGLSFCWISEVFISTYTCGDHHPHWYWYYARQFEGRGTVADFSSYKLTD